MQTTSENPVGKPLVRSDGRLKVTGGAVYAAEAPVQNAAHGALVGSTIAKGTIASIDASEAEASPGVIIVITPQNMPKLTASRGMSGDPRVPLSDMNIHYAGQYVALVVAATPEQARHAATLVKVNYAPEQAII